MIFWTWINKLVTIIEHRIRKEVYYEKENNY